MLQIYQIRQAGAKQFAINVYTCKNGVMPFELSVSGEGTIHAGNLPEGIYIVQVFSEDKHVQTLKMQVKK
jgi:hypothetical protein